MNRSQNKAIPLPRLAEEGERIVVVSRFASESSGSVWTTETC
jgi:hypothetical protein